MMTIHDDEVTYGTRCTVLKIVPGRETVLIPATIIEIHRNPTPRHVDGEDALVVDAVVARLEGGKGLAGHEDVYALSFISSNIRARRTYWNVVAGRTRRLVRTMAEYLAWYREEAGAEEMGNGYRQLDIGSLAAWEAVTKGAA